MEKCGVMLKTALMDFMVGVCPLIVVKMRLSSNSPTAMTMKYVN